MTWHASGWLIPKVVKGKPDRAMTVTRYRIEFPGGLNAEVFRRGSMWGYDVGGAVDVSPGEAFTSAQLAMSAAQEALLHISSENTKALKRLKPVRMDG